VVRLYQTSQDRLFFFQFACSRDVFCVSETCPLLNQEAGFKNGKAIPPRPHTTEHVKRTKSCLQILSMESTRYFN
jgi:hypothetical protein